METLELKYAPAKIKLLNGWAQEQNREERENNQ